MRYLLSALMLVLAAATACHTNKTTAVPRMPTAPTPAPYIQVASCTGGDDSKLVQGWVASRVETVIQAGQVCGVENLRVPTGHSIVCETGGTLKKAGSLRASYLMDQNGEEVEVRGCTFDGANALLVNDHAELLRLNNGKFTFTKCVFKNVGSRSAGGSQQIDIVRAWNSSLVVEDSKAVEGVSGKVVYFDPNKLITNTLRVHGNVFSGGGNSAVWVGNNSGTILPAVVDIGGNMISNFDDDTGGTGQAGNGIQLWQIEGGIVHDNILRGNRFSGVRLAKVRHALVYGNLMDGNREVSLYCSELGGSGNSCYGNTIINYVSGISSTNQEQRQYQDEPDVLDNNYLKHGSFYAIAVQGSVATNNTIDGAPIGIRIGIAKSYGHLVRGNRCLSSDGQPMAACLVMQFDVPKGIDIVEGNTKQQAVAASESMVLAANIGMWQRVIGVDLGAQTVVHVNSGGTSPMRGQTVCLAGLFGTVELNGKCGKVTATGSYQYTLDLDSTNAGAYVRPDGGQQPYSFILSKADGSPPFAFSNTLVLRDAVVPQASVSGLHDGSDVIVTGARCVAGQVIAGSEQVHAVKKNGSLVCQ